MIKNALLLLLLTAAAYGSSQAQEVKKYVLDVHDFTELKVIDAINVEYRASADSAGMVAFECSKEMASHMIFTNKKNSLHVQVDFENIPYGPLPTLRVYSNTLYKIENSGDSTVSALRLPTALNEFDAKLIGNGTLKVINVQADKVNASISTGAGHLFISGKCLKAKLHNIGTGPLEANSLNCNQAKCVLVGTGPIDCHVTGELNIIGAGSGTVYYSGKPTKVNNRTLGVKAKPVE